MSAYEHVQNIVNWQQSGDGKGLSLLSSDDNDIDNGNDNDNDCKNDNAKGNISDNTDNNQERWQGSPQIVI